MPVGRQYALSYTTTNNNNNNNNNNFFVAVPFYIVFWMLPLFNVLCPIFPATLFHIVLNSFCFVLYFL
jgi:hypothetical protein